MVAWEQWEEMHAFVELTCLAIWIPGVSSILDYWFTHLLSDHALNKDTWVERLIHISYYHFRFVKEFTAANQVDDPTESPRSFLFVREEFFKYLLPILVELEAISL